MELNGLSWEGLAGLIGLTLVLTVSAGFGPLKAWCATRAHSFWPWLVMVMAEPLWIGFWAGWWWSVYSGNRIFESLIFGGIVAVAAHAVHETLTYLSALSGISARRYAQEGRQQPRGGRGRRLQLPSAKDPKLSEDEAHALMDRHDENEQIAGPNDLH
jgi:hypothetical protein